MEKYTRGEGGWGGWNLPPPNIFLEGADRCKPVQIDANPTSLYTTKAILITWLKVGEILWKSGLKALPG